MMLELTRTLTVRSLLALVSGSLFLLPAQETGSPVVAETVSISKGVPRHLRLTGSIVSARQSRLSTRVAGFVKEMKVDIGSIVKEGDILASLDATLESLALERIQADVAEAKILLEDAERQVNEVEKLARSGGVAPTEFNRLLAARSVAEIKVRQLEVEEKVQRERLDHHEIRAPFAGVVSRKVSEAGEWIQPGTPLLEVVETSPLWFDVRMPQEAGGFLGLKPEMNITLDAFPGRTFPAEFSLQVPVKDDVTRTFLARFKIDGGDTNLTPGMSGSAEFTAREGDEDVILIPRDALLRSPDGAVSVWVVGGAADQPVAESRAVRIEDDLSSSVRVLSGLSAGDRVIIRGNEALRPGETLRLLPSPATHP